MQVYIEYAIAENFCMDFILFCSAKAITKNPTSYLRMSISSALGAAFAVVYPLFALSGIWGIAVKVCSGFALCTVAGKYSSYKGYVKFSLAFFLATFISGGAIFALFSLANVSFEQGGGFIISSVPVGIPLFAVTVIAIIIKKLRDKFTAHSAKETVCKIFYGEKSAVCKGFYDSGNKVYSHGSPVSVIPAHIANMLTDVEGIKTFAHIHTVAGEGKLPVFTADKIEIDDGKNKTCLKGVTLGVSPKHISKIVLHSDLLEGI